MVTLTINVRRRTKAEKKVKEQIAVINERNQSLMESHKQQSELNSELEEANAQLMSMNISLEDAKKKAEESERLKSSFLANLSHEIRTPLNAILGFSSLLVNSNLKEETKENYNKIITSNSESLLVLIDDILDFSKIEAGQVQIHTEEILINDIIGELVSFYNQKSEKPNLQIRVSDFLRKNKVLLQTDKTRFKQIVSNLLSNAFKFTENGFIEIGTKIKNSQELIFYVEDTGLGIDKKFHTAIFERFRKIEDVNTRYYGGSGLGLAICKKLISLLGGEIWVEGDSGKGSTFFFTHPGYIITGSEFSQQQITGKPTIKYNWQN
ncbi:MAG: hypothetical protein HC905_21665, partial [Bacteroidales bacterium]|nr:hypothetical protein [Bacteroidales bacterium]